MRTWGVFPLPPPRLAVAAGAEVRALALVEAAFLQGVRPGILLVLGVVLIAVLFVMIPLIITRIARRGMLVLVQASNDVVR